MSASDMWRRRYDAGMPVEQVLSDVLKYLDDRQHQERLRYSSRFYERVSSCEVDKYTYPPRLAQVPEHAVINHYDMLNGGAADDDIDYFWMDDSFAFHKVSINGSLLMANGNEVAVVHFTDF